MKKESFIYLFFVVFLLGLAIMYGIYIGENEIGTARISIQEDLLEKETAAKKKAALLLDYFQNDYSTSIEEWFLTKQANELGTESIVFYEDSCVFWTENFVPFELPLLDSIKHGGLIVLKNGIYDVMIEHRNESHCLEFIKIKNSFSYLNKYLNTDLLIGADKNKVFDVVFEKNGQDIYSLSNDYLFSIKKSGKQSVYGSKEAILFVLYFAVFLFVLAFLFNFYLELKKKYIRFPLFISFVFALDVFIVRAIIYYFKIPVILYGTVLFSPEYFASSVLSPTAGDFFVNLICLLAIVLFFARFKWNDLFRIEMNLFRNLFAGILLVFLVLFYDLLILQIERLVLDSSVSLGLQNIFKFELSALIRVFSIATLLLIYFIVARSFIRHIADTFKTKPKYLILLGGSLFILNFVLCNGVDSVSQFIAFVFISIVFLSHFFENRGVATLVPIVSLLLFAFMSARLISKYQEQKALKTQDMMVETLLVQENPVLSYLYKGIEREIFNRLNEKRIFLNSQFLGEQEGFIEELVLEEFDDPFWDNYNIYPTVCDSTRDLLIEPDNYLTNCEAYFNDMIVGIGTETNCKGLFLLDQNSIEKNYIGHLEFILNEIAINVYIEIYSKFIPEGLGYPELLVNHTSELAPFLADHSIAKYRDGELVYKFGKYNYSVDFTHYSKDFEIGAFVNRNGFNHYLYKLDNQTSIIVSNKSEGLYSFIAPLAYLLVVFSVYMLLFFLLTGKPSSIFTSVFTFRKKLQISIISIVFATFVFVGVFSVFYIIKINGDKTQNILEEKSHSVLIELEHKLSDIKHLKKEHYPYLEEILNKFSKVFFTDINLFDLGGFVVASSRPQIFEKGLISKRMDETAKFRILKQNKLLYIQKEKIGNYEYLSAYLPFRNSEKKIIAVLNLPYFARQDEVEDEISTFITAFFNIYTIIFVISIIITIIISQQLTKPLLLIRSKMAKLELIKKNEKIKWNRNDELGLLIEEYNRMVDELARSAEKLAKSERETAWREMAKQVAHEIKNPLTPMRLSIQHMMRLMDNDENWKLQFRKISSSLIEQIDSLSAIATEFSDFAIMPVANMEELDLCEVLKSEIYLYNNSQLYRIILDIETKAPCYVKADRKQLQRVFKNLINNAIQAVEDVSEPLIVVKLLEIPGYFSITIRDNGVGVEQELKDKIFSPNFTTKSSGMGLGLSIVKSIVLDTGGKIDFESEYGKGTTFIVDLPILKS
jgi:signal transduction histidine kinase